MEEGCHNESSRTHRLLAEADPDSVVIFLDSYTESDASDEIREVFISSDV